MAFYNKCGAFMGTSQELAYLIYFKGAESKKNGTQAKLSFLPSNLHIKMATKLHILLSRWTIFP